MCCVCVCVCVCVCICVRACACVYEATSPLGREAGRQLIPHCLGWGRCITDVTRCAHAPAWPGPTRWLVQHTLKTLAHLSQIHWLISHCCWRKRESTKLFLGASCLHSTSWMYLEWILLTLFASRFRFVDTAIVTLPRSKPNEQWAGYD